MNSFVLKIFIFQSGDLERGPRGPEKPNENILFHD